jgi:hypothetical protein
MFFSSQYYIKAKIFSRKMNKSISSIAIIKNNKSKFQHKGYGVNIFCCGYNKKITADEGWHLR